MNSLLVLLDANSNTGYGHLFRSFNVIESITDKLPLIEIAFAGIYDSFAHDFFLKNNLKSINLNSINEVSELSFNKDSIFIDNYILSQTLLDNLCQKFKNVILMDDFNKYNTENVSVVINFTVMKKDLDYKSKKKFIGPTYFPASKEMRSIRERNISSNYKFSDTTFLLFIGGNDIYNIGPKVLSVLDSIINDKIIIYITSSNISFESQKNRIIVNALSLGLEPLIANTDYLISGGGLTKYESAFCNIPNASITQTSDQYLDTVPFASKNLTVDLGLASNWDQEKCRMGLKALVDSNWSDKFHNSSKDVFKINSFDIMINEIMEG